MSYRPICDTWILARPKVPYHGAFPSGFLERARQLLGVGPLDPVLHVCAGKVRDYPFQGFGPLDKTLDLDPACAPDFLMDAREIGMRHTGKNGALEAHPSARNTWVSPQGTWGAVLIDRPYTEEDAAKYAPGASKLPQLGPLLKNCLEIVAPGRRVGVLDYLVPRPPREGVRFTALVHVLEGFGNRSRAYSVFERDGSTPEQRQRSLDAVRGKKPASTGRFDVIPEDTMPDEDEAGPIVVGLDLSKSREELAAMVICRECKRVLPHAGAAHTCFVETPCAGYEGNPFA